MNVIHFPRVPETLPQGWQANELAKLTNACAASIPSGDVSGWEVGTTEYGDPQLYLLGPAPDHDCILSHFAARPPLCAGRRQGPGAVRER